MSDRTFAAFFGQKELIFTTDSYKFYGSSAKSIIKKVNLVDDEEWFYIYMGYNNKIGKTITMVKTVRDTYILNWDDSRKYVPR